MAEMTMKGKEWVDSRLLGQKVNKSARNKKKRRKKKRPQSIIGAMGMKVT